eukprot:m.188527 g.188527  ORF g.188527 m.188527 type:complete len:530 (-) comp21653_c0_seq1:106-1695(-)
MKSFVALLGLAALAATLDTGREYVRQATMLKLGKKAEALSLLAEGTTRFPEECTLYILLADLQASLRQLQEARANYERLLFCEHSTVALRQRAFAFLSAASGPLAAPGAAAAAQRDPEQHLRPDEYAAVDWTNLPQHSQVKQLELFSTPIWHTRIPDPGTVVAELDCQHELLSRPVAPFVSVAQAALRQQLANESITVAHAQWLPGCPGCYAPLTRASTALLLGKDDEYVGYFCVASGETDMRGHFMYLLDPRAASSTTVWPAWVDAGIPRALDLTVGSLALFPSYVQWFSLPNVDERERACFFFHTNLQTLDGVERGWSTPLLHATDTLPPALRQTLAAYLLAQEAQEESVFKSNKGGWQSHTDLLERPTPELCQLRTLLYTLIHRYMASYPTSFMPSERQGRLQLHIHSAWGGINRLHHMNSPHVHPDSHVSGAVYLRTPSVNNSIVFVDPRRRSDLQQVAVHPQEGDVVLFPSWLQHAVPPSDTESPRIIVSFNARVKHLQDKEGLSEGSARSVCEVPRHHPQCFL